MSISEVGNKKPAVEEAPKAPVKKQAEEPKKESEEAAKVSIQAKPKESVKDNQKQDGEAAEKVASSDDKQAAVNPAVKKYQDVQESLAS